MPHSHNIHIAKHLKLEYTFLYTYYEKAYRRRPCSNIAEIALAEDSLERSVNSHEMALHSDIHI